MRDEEVRYRGGLRQLCTEALAETEEFAVVLQHLQGADPLCALSVLGEIAVTDSPQAGAAKRCMSDVRRLGATLSPSPLPIVHPLDFHWPFSPSTIEGLRIRIEHISRPGDTVVFLGTPLLHRHAAALLKNRRCLLIDRDPRVVALARSVGTEAEALDLSADDLPEVNASCAIADPPWYPDATLAFTEAASQMVRRGGLLLLSFPARFTRPGIDEERAALLDRSDRLGFDLVEEDPLGLGYETPPFEQSAMAAAGLSATPARWRRGDLFTFSLRGPAPQRRKAESEKWLAYEIEQIPIYVNPSAPSLGRDLIGALVEGDVLPTVSSRHPARSKAALWTSRNRIFASSDPGLLSQVLADVSAGQDCSGLAASMLHELAAKERVEHGLAAPALTLST